MLSFLVLVSDRAKKIVYGDKICRFVALESVLLLFLTDLVYVNMIWVMWDCFETGL